MSSLRESFPALQHRDFRLLWFGQLVSTSGSLMHNAAILWHVALLAPEHERAAALGLVGLVKFLPIVLFSLISGVVADAVDRRKLMLVTQTTLALVGGILAWITFRGLDHVWPLYVLSAIMSGVGSFDAPARQSLIPKLVPAHHFANAISLNTILFQIAAVSGPLLAGVAIAHLGLGWVYALNSGTYVCVIAALLAMKPLPPRPDEEKVAISFASAWEGLAWVFKAPLIRSSMLLDFFATFFASATALLPIFAVDILDVGERGYGILVAAPAIGAVAASLWMTRYSESIVRRGKVLLWSVIAYGCATIAFGLSTSFALTFACLALTGVADTVSMVLRNVIRQLSTPDRMRGRMTGVNMVFFMGGPQLGEVEAGFVAHAFGPVFSVVSGGIGCIAATAWLAWKTPQLREYRRPDETRIVQGSS
jgi:MFS family permease